MATAFSPTSHSQQGVGAARNGFQIGGTTIMTGDGTPSTYALALRIGDLYVDYTNGAIWIASATGTGGWVQYTAAGATMASNSTIGGTSIQTGAGTPQGVKTAGRIGDIAIDYTNGQLYVANATGTAGWIMVGGGAVGQYVEQIYSAVIPLATLQAGATFLPAITGMSYTILGYHISTASGTPAGSGNFIVQDTGGTLNAVTATVAQIASASSPGAAITESTFTLATIGAYTGKKMTASAGVKVPAMASLTGPYTMQLNVKYVLAV